MNSSGDVDPGTSTELSHDGRNKSPLPFREPRWLLSFFGERRGDESQRLAAEMVETWYRATEARGGEKAPHPSGLRLIEQAAIELGHRRREAAWALSLAARRELIQVLDEPRRQALAVSIREEAAEKLPEWRRRAVERLVPDDGRAPNPAALVEALQHIDAVGSNQARSQRILRRQLAILALILLATVGILVTLLVAWLPAPQPETLPEPTATSLSPLSGLATDRLAVLTVLFGVLGACISSIQRATSMRRRLRVPGLRAAMWASLTRPLVGAAAGLVIWALAAEGVLGNQGLGLLGFAFAAGFSERVILRFIPDPPDSSAKPDQSSSEPNQSNSERTRREPPKGRASD
jgi:hypothetical protein